MPEKMTLITYDSLKMLNAVNDTHKSFETFMRLDIFFVITQLWKNIYMYGVLYLSFCYIIIHYISDLLYIQVCPPFLFNDRFEMSPFCANWPSIGLKDLTVFRKQFMFHPTTISTEYYVFYKVFSVRRIIFSPAKVLQPLTKAFSWGFKLQSFTKTSTC